MEDLSAPWDLRLGWPLCECGHSHSLHSGGPCRRIECLVGGIGRCTFYRPSQPLPPDSPAAFATMVQGMCSHVLPEYGLNYNRHEIAGIIGDVVAQLAVQWSGWRPPEKG
jgi:hypothetical protein